MNRAVQTSLIEPDTISVISLWPPWANWVALGWKTIESRLHRRFAGLVGQRIGIHCALKWDESAIETARPYLSQAQIDCTHNFLRIGGSVMCTALVSEERWLTLDDARKALIECETRRHGIVLTDLQQIEAIPMRGHQGIWKAPRSLFGEPQGNL